MGVLLLTSHGGRYEGKQFQFDLPPTVGHGGREQVVIHVGRKKPSSESQSFGYVVLKHDVEVSSRHATIVLESRGDGADGVAHLRELGSTNGTKLYTSLADASTAPKGGQAVPKDGTPVPIAIGSVISVGLTLLRVCSLPWDSGADRSRARDYAGQETTVRPLAPESRDRPSLVKPTDECHEDDVAVDAVAPPVSLLGSRAPASSSAASGLPPDGAEPSPAPRVDSKDEAGPGPGDAVAASSPLSRNDAIDAQPHGVKDAGVISETELGTSHKESPAEFHGECNQATTGAATVLPLMQQEAGLGVSSAASRAPSCSTAAPAPVVQTHPRQPVEVAAAESGSASSAKEARRTPEKTEASSGLSQVQHLHDSVDAALQLLEAVKSQLPSAPQPVSGKKRGRGASSADVQPQLSRALRDSLCESIASAQGLLGRALESLSIFPFPDVLMGDGANTPLTGLHSGSSARPQESAPSSSSARQQQQQDNLYSNPSAERQNSASHHSSYGMVATKEAAAAAGNAEFVIDLADEDDDKDASGSRKPTDARVAVASTGASSATGNPRKALKLLTSSAPRVRGDFDISVDGDGIDVVPGAAPFALGAAGAQVTEDAAKKKPKGRGKQSLWPSLVGATPGSAASSLAPGSTEGAPPEKKKRGRPGKAAGSGDVGGSAGPQGHDREDGDEEVLVVDGSAAPAAQRKKKRAPGAAPGAASSSSSLLPTVAPAGAVTFDADDGGTQQKKRRKRKGEVEPDPAAALAAATAAAPLPSATDLIATMFPGLPPSQGTGAATAAAAGAGMPQSASAGAAASSRLSFSDISGSDDDGSLDSDVVEVTTADGNGPFTARRARCKSRASSAQQAAFPPSRFLEADRDVGPSRFGGVVLVAASDSLAVTGLSLATSSAPVPSSAAPLEGLPLSSSDHQQVAPSSGSLPPRLEKRLSLWDVATATGKRGPSRASVTPASNAPVIGDDASVNHVPSAAKQGDASVPLQQPALTTGSLAASHASSSSLPPVPLPSPSRLNSSLGSAAFLPPAFSQSVYHTSVLSPVNSRAGHRAGGQGVAGGGSEGDGLRGSGLFSSSSSTSSSSSVSRVLQPAPASRGAADVPRVEAGASVVALDPSNNALRGTTRSPHPAASATVFFDETVIEGSDGSDDDMNEAGRAAAALLPKRAAAGNDDDAAALVPDGEDDEYGGVRRGHAGSEMSGAQGGGPSLLLQLVGQLLQHDSDAELEQACPALPSPAVRCEALGPSTLPSPAPTPTVAPSLGVSPLPGPSLPQLLDVPQAREFPPVVIAALAGCRQQDLVDMVTQYAPDQWAGSIRFALGKPPYELHTGLGNMMRGSPAFYEERSGSEPSGWAEFRMSGALAVFAAVTRALLVEAGHEPVPVFEQEDEDEGYDEGGGGGIDEEAAPASSKPVVLPSCCQPSLCGSRDDSAPGSRSGGSAPASREGVPAPENLPPPQPTSRRWELGASGPSHSAHTTVLARAQSLTGQFRATQVVDSQDDSDSRSSGVAGEHQCDDARVLGPRSFNGSAAVHPVANDIKGARDYTHAPVTLGSQASTCSQLASTLYSGSVAASGHRPSQAAPTPGPLPPSSAAPTPAYGTMATAELARHMTGIGMKPGERSYMIEELTDSWRYSRGHRHELQPQGQPSQPTPRASQPAPEAPVSPTPGSRPSAPYSPPGGARSGRGRSESEPLKPVAEPGVVALDDSGGDDDDDDEETTDGLLDLCGGSAAATPVSIDLSLPLAEQVKAFILTHEGLFEAALLFEPLKPGPLLEALKGAGIIIAAPQLRAVADEMCLSLSHRWKVSPLRGRGKQQGGKEPGT